MSLRLLSRAAFGGVLLASAACGSSDSDSDPGAGGGSQAGTSGADNAGSGGLMGGSAGNVAAGAGGGDGGSSAGNGGEAATGGTGGTPELPSIDPEKNIRDITTDEKAELCDWVADLYGGYGTRTECSNGSTVQFFSDQPQCLAAGFMYACLTVTVGDVERCSIARAPSGGCNSPEEACGALDCNI